MKRLMLLTVIASINLFAYAQKYSLSSPDGKLTAAIEIDNGIHVAVLKGRNYVFRLGNIYLQTAIVLPLKDEYKVQKVIRKYGQ